MEKDGGNHNKFFINDEGINKNEQSNPNLNDKTQEFVLKHEK